MAASTLKRQGLARVGSNLRARRALYGIAAVLLLTILPLSGIGNATTQNSAAGTPAASPAASPVASPSVEFTTGEITIEITDEAMQPGHFQSAVGHELILTVVNSGSEVHGFVIDEMDVDLELEPGERETVEIGAPDLGEYRYYSDLPGDEGLEGTMTIFI